MSDIANHCEATERPAELMTTGQAARLLHLSRQRVQQFVTEGRLPVAGYAGTSRLVARSAVEALAAARALDPPRRGRPPGSGMSRTTGAQ